MSHHCTLKEDTETCYGSSLREYSIARYPEHDPVGSLPAAFRCGVDRQFSPYKSWGLRTDYLSPGHKLHFRHSLDILSKGTACAVFWKWPFGGVTSVI